MFVYELQRCLGFRVKAIIPPMYVEGQVTAPCLVVHVSVMWTAYKACFNLAARLVSFLAWRDSIAIFELERDKDKSTI